MSTTLTTSFTSNNTHYLNTKNPFSVKFEKLYKEVIQVTETEPSQYAYASDFKNELKNHKTIGRRPNRMTLESYCSLNDEIGKTKLSLLTGKTIPLNEPYSFKEKKIMMGTLNQKDKEERCNDKLKSTVDTLRQIKKSLRKNNGLVLTSKMFKSLQRNNKYHYEAKGNNDFINKMKKSFPEYLTPMSSFISSEKPNTQRIGRIRYQLNKS